MNNKRITEEKKVELPVTMAVRLDASIPSVTSWAVEADPNPLGPRIPVTKENMPTIILLLTYLYVYQEAEEGKESEMMK